MNSNTATAIIVTGFFVMIGLACLAAHSADPLLALFLLVFLLFL